MYGGENSGMPLGADPVNNGTGTFGADDNYDQPAAIVSGGEDGGAVAFDSSNKSNNNSAKFFGRRSRESATRADAAQTQANAELAAASSIANNPNNPDFFRQAAAENATSQIQRQPRQINKKPFIVLGLLLGIAVIVASVVMLWPKEKTLASANTVEAFNRFANYMLTGEEKTSKLGEKEYKDYKATLMAREIESEESKLYFEKAKELFDELEGAVKEDEALKENEEFKDAFEAYRDYFYITYNNFKFVDLTDNQIMDSFSVYGELGTVEMVDRHFASLLGDKLDSLSSSRHEYAILYVHRLGIYKKYSCVNGITVNEDCAYSIVDEELAENAQQMNTVIEQINGHIVSSRNLIADDLWELNAKLRGQNEEQ